jgi:pimeloyl-ACP methyl ester carboxylesterase
MTALAIAIVVLLAAGVVYQALSSARDATRSPAPGKFVSVYRRRIHINVQGSGTPTVVLEAGISASSLSWSALQPQIAGFARVVSYDRAGLGWSDRARVPCTPSPLADELHEMLHAAAIAPPYVVVGHSYGGLIVRAFAAKYPEEVVGIVLVDSLHEGEWLQPTRTQRRILQGGVLFSRIGALLAAFGVVRLCLDLLSRGAGGAGKGVLSLFGPTATKVVTRIVGEVAKLPREVLPSIRSHWSRPKSFWTMSRYIGALPQSSAQMRELPPLPKIQLAVLSADSEDPHRRAEQQQLAQLCAEAEHMFVPECGHWIHLDRPTTVADAVRRMVERFQQKRL